MADPVQFSIPHSLGTLEARSRIAGGIGQLESMIPGSRMTSSEWDGDRLNFTIEAFGQRVISRLDIEDDRIGVHLDLPPLLAGFAARISEKLRKTGQKLLS